MIKLKKFRVQAGLTQKALAEAIGVSQPNYQRWESGSAAIPESKLKKLAKVLKTTSDALMGTHAPIKAGFYDKSVGDDLNYYGEVAVHFRSGATLLLSISDGACSRLHFALQRNVPFVAVESLSNQTVIIRTEAIADLYFSSEAYDDFGPEHSEYDYLTLQMPDARDWEIVEALECQDEISLEEFAPEDVERVMQSVMITDEQYESLIAEGRIKREELQNEKEKNQKITNKIFDLATKIKYHLSSGQEREVEVMSAQDVYETFYEFVDFDGGIDDGLILLPMEGWHRMAFVNKHALDYVMLPTHRFEQGRTESNAAMLDPEMN